jgi:short-subunit dehydrogenase
VQVSSHTRAFVTGASRGIGRALAERLAARGATVGLAARSTDELAALADALPPPAAGGGHVVLGCDVGDVTSVSSAVERFITTSGGLDLLVANAGIAHHGPFRDQPLERAEQMTRVNWLGTVYTVHAGLRHMVDRRAGHIVIVSSGAGLRSFPGAAAYGATKGAQRMFGEALRHELAGTGVSLTVVYPGEIATTLHDHERSTMPDWYRGGPGAVPAGRLADRMIRAVERDSRSLHYPPLVRLVGIAHGISPALADRLLRRMRGSSAAPHLD